MLTKLLFPYFLYQPFWKRQFSPQLTKNLSQEILFSFISLFLLFLKKLDLPTFLRWNAKKSNSCSSKIRSFHVLELTLFFYYIGPTIVTQRMVIYIVFQQVDTWTLYRSGCCTSSAFLLQLSATFQQLFTTTYTRSGSPSMNFPIQNNLPRDWRTQQKLKQSETSTRHRNCHRRPPFYHRSLLWIGPNFGDRLQWALCSGLPKTVQRSP